MEFKNVGSPAANLSGRLMTCGWPALVLAAWVLAGCYNPQIQDGGLICSARGECPSGFHCRADNTCAKNQGGVAGQAGGGTAGGSGAGGAGGTGGVAMCLGPLAGCVASTGGTCDPVCQANCKCNERCTVSNDKVGCETLDVAPNATKKVGETCTIDNCAPGLACLADDPTGSNACGNHCYRYCRTDAECTGGAHCANQLVDKSGLPAGLPIVCDKPPELCNPIFGGAKCLAADQQLPAFGCYLMGGKFPNESVCDCAGSTPEGASCTYERQCSPGLICISNGDGATTGTCKRVCPLRNDVSTVQICGTKSCLPFNNSAKWGTCG